MSAEAWTAVFSAVLAITGVWALVYARQQLKQARESERVQHLLRFVEQFDNAPFANIRKALAEKRIKGIDDPPELDNVLNFFETIGLLVKRGYLDAHDVWSSFSYWIFCIFADGRETIEQEQKEDPTYYSDFTGLVEKLEGIEKAEHGLSGRPSKEDITEFWQYELELTAGLPATKRRPRKRLRKKN
jgi:hypothetical protein